MFHLVPVPRHLTVTFLWHQEEKPTSTSSAWNDFHQRRPSSCDSSMYFSVCVSYGGQRADIYLRNSVSFNCLCYRSASAVRCWEAAERQVQETVQKQPPWINNRQPRCLITGYVVVETVCVCVKCQWLTEIKKQNKPILSEIYSTFNSIRGWAASQSQLNTNRFNFKQQ